MTTPITRQWRFLLVAALSVLSLTCSLLIAGSTPANAASSHGYRNMTLTATKSGTILVKWKKTTNVKKYEIRTYKTSNLKSVAKKYTVSKKKTSVAVRPAPGAGRNTGNYTWVKIFVHKTSGSVVSAPLQKVRMASQTPRSSNRATIATYNVRTAHSEIRGNTWAQRKSAVANDILKSGAGIISIQEAGAHIRNWWQFHDLMDMVSSKYASVTRELYVHKGQTLGKQGTRILYDQSRFTLVDHGSWVLPGLARDKGGNTRWAAWALMHDVNTGKPLYVVSAHFDNRKESTASQKKSKPYHKLRVKQADSLIKNIRALAKGGTQVVLAGDLNTNLYSFPSNAVHTKFIRAGFYDTYAAPKNINEYYATSNGFKKAKASAARTDYILTYGGQKGAYSYKNWIVKSGRIPSDHFMQTATVPF